MIQKKDTRKPENIENLKGFLQYEIPSTLVDIFFIFFQNLLKSDGKRAICSGL